jgi:energy-converting hydrogenase A subunit R
VEPHRRSLKKPYRQKRSAHGAVETGLKRFFVSDCEGPISKNDNAFELAEQFIPQGGNFFSNISRYDDVLADVICKPGYSAGSTLKLILPFFKAYGVTDRQMEVFSAKNIVLIEGSKITLKHVCGLTDAFIVSTSYEHYIRALCKVVDFPFKNTYCTRVGLDKVTISPGEKEKLREVAQEIGGMRQINIPLGLTTAEGLSDCDQILLHRLDEIFWAEIPQMAVGKLLTDVTTVGGEEKAESIRDAAKRHHADLCDVMYVGDSITDVEAFKLAKENGGLAVSFNGNSYAVKNADIVVISESNFATAAIAELFIKLGREETLKTISPWSLQALKGKVDQGLLTHLSSAAEPKVQIVTTENMDSLIKESSGFRKKVRGVAIGRLG